MLTVIAWPVLEKRVHTLPLYCFIWRLQGDQTCTQRKCEWILPSFKQNVEYLPVKDIDFTSAKGKKRKLDDAINTVSDAIVPITPQQYNKVIPIREDYDTFYEHLSSTGT